MKPVDSEGSRYRKKAGWSVAYLGEDLRNKLERLRAKERPIPSVSMVIKRAVELWVNNH